MGSTYFSKRYHPDGARHRKRRPKTFDTEEKAKAYAAAKGLKDAKIVANTFGTKFLIK